MNRHDNIAVKAQAVKKLLMITASMRIVWYVKVTETSNNTTIRKDLPILLRTKFKIINCENTQNIKPDKDFDIRTHISHSLKT
jgi:hypothetical protein